ncbi:MAG: hypothetical protein CMJ77_00610 [Planctomycetaceae bacterium]|nr:hypothetical protein [Planctomycetaceae bacterium]
MVSKFFAVKENGQMNDTSKYRFIQNQTLKIRKGMWCRFQNHLKTLQLIELEVFLNSGEVL